METSRTYRKSPSNIVGKTAGLTRQRAAVAAGAAVEAFVAAGALSREQAAGILADWGRVGPELWSDPYYASVPEHTAAALEELKRSAAASSRCGKRTTIGS